MPFASLKKSSKRNQRHYKERQQPSGRSHLGHLEKHKDYLVRARDYQRKAATLKSLRQRAREKNSDEFYFHMARSRLVDGKHTEMPASGAASAKPGKTGSGTDGKRVQQILLEDSNYLRHKLQIERAQLAKLEAGLGLVTDGAGGIKTVFDRADFRRLKSTSSSTSSAAATAAAATAAAADLDNGPRWLEYLGSLDKSQLAQLVKERARGLKTVKQRMARFDALSSSLAQLEAKRNLAAEVGRPRKLVAQASGDAPAVWKFAFKRKR